MGVYKKPPPAKPEAAAGNIIMRGIMFPARRIYTSSFTQSIKFIKILVFLIKYLLFLCDFEQKYDFYIKKHQPE